ncbi:MAG TPA: rhodanese-like domain-containing protein [Candidatus Desulfobacillus sp.]|nr:rhodanese-like domain-containing protein [Candidatus Desulfobacillus sp.]
MEFIKDNLTWFGLALLSGGMFVWQSWQARGGRAGVSPMQATLLINREDAVVVDVREQGEYTGGHIPNSRHIPLSQLDKRLGELEKFKERSLIVSCASGNRSSSACGKLRRAGFAKVFNLTGGVSAWDQAGLPVTKK